MTCQIYLIEKVRYVGFWNWLSRVSHIGSHGMDHGKIKVMRAPWWLRVEEYVLLRPDYDCAPKPLSHFNALEARTAESIVELYM